MSSSLGREHLKWLLRWENQVLVEQSLSCWGLNSSVRLYSLDLSYTVKNPRRDFSNGFLLAEILYRYYPTEVQLHSFENVNSIERKRQNWSLLMKLFKVGCMLLLTALLYCWYTWSFWSAFNCREKGFQLKKLLLMLLYQQTVMQQWR